MKLLEAVTFRGVRPLITRRGLYYSPFFKMVLAESENNFELLETVSFRGLRPVAAPGFSKLWGGGANGEGQGRTKKLRVSPNQVRMGRVQRITFEPLGEFQVVYHN